MAVIIVYKAGMDMFDLEVDCITIPVNKKGVMGSGLALYAKQTVPGLYESYHAYCKEGWDSFTYLYKQCNTGRSRTYLCLATKVNWMHSSELEYITQGCKELVRSYRDWGIKSIAIPALGCGCGQLWWEDVLPAMIKELMLADDDLEVHICPPM